MERTQEYLARKWRHWHYKNTALLLISLAVFFYLAETATAQAAIKAVGNYGYLGAFITGIFFVSTFTVAPAAVVLYNLAKSLHPLEIALLAGAGGMVGDFLLYRYLKDRVFIELKYFFHRHRSIRLANFFRTPYFAWLSPILGAILIASPFPDEVGVGLIGMSKMKTWKFLVISFLLDAVGIFLIVLLAAD
ncbi:hypothetical protein HY346_02455 [Candidatus Microgenomates bacterium]|nr:hypothetical protein [Candidatus Microgenomates bacterium]